MMRVLRKMAGLSDKPVSEPDTASKPDKLSADVANASQRVSERTDQVRATLAELLKASDAKRSPVIQGFQ